MCIHSFNLYRYEALCEVADQICSVSNGLCRVMGLPLREFSQRDESGSGDKLGEPDGVAPSQPSSPGNSALTIMYI